MELGAVATIPVIVHLFRKQRAKVVITANTEVEDYVPSVLLLLNIVLLIVASFLPGLPANINGYICIAIFVVSAAYSLLRRKIRRPGRNRPARDRLPDAPAADLPCL